jgi:ribosomal protein S18 acetylase RimI-like enzyme
MRRYRGPADLRLMQTAVQRLPGPAAEWHVGDLAWARFQNIGNETRWRTALWTDADGAVIAFGWTELPARLELFVDPGHSSLIPEVLAWFDHVATAGQRTVSTVDTNQPVIDALTAADYEVDDTAPFFCQGSRSLAAAIQVAPLPSGFTARTVTDHDGSERALIHRAAFVPSRVTEASYRDVASAWPYRRELDWVVEGPDGRFVASVLIWFDEPNRVGQLEPVGTAPEYRRRGLARSVCATAMNALRDLGGEHAVVNWRGDAGHPGPAELYADLGFVARLRSLTFTRQ